MNYSDNDEIHLTISFWTSAEIINETHLIDDQRISEFELHDEALGHRFCKIFVILIPDEAKSFSGSKLNC